MQPELARPTEALDRFGSVSAEVRSDLERFVALLEEWQRVHNLVSRASLEEIWTRHVADSLQLREHAPPKFSEWVDLGSGAGFPGLVVAIAAKGKAGVVPPPSPATGEEPSAVATSATERPILLPHFTLVEANQKKAAFLRAAIRETGANASVAAERIEAHAARMAGRADVVSARALAPLPALCGLAAPYLHARSVLLLLKGQDFVHEIDEASKYWRFDVIDSPSATDSGGRILAIRNLKPKGPRR